MDPILYGVLFMSLTDPIQISKIFNRVGFSSLSDELGRWLSSELGRLEIIRSIFWCSRDFDWIKTGSHLNRLNY